MFKKKKILGIIPARSGSKSIKNKNYIKLLNKPLIKYSIESANLSKYLDRVIVSTDNTKLLKKYKIKCDIPFIRPKKFSTDNSKTIETVIHCLNF